MSNEHPKAVAARAAAKQNRAIRDALNAAHRKGDM